MSRIIIVCLLVAPLVHTGQAVAVTPSGPFEYRTNLVNPISQANDYFGLDMFDLNGLLLVGSPGAGATYVYEPISGLLQKTYQHPTLFAQGTSVAGTSERIYVAGNGVVRVLNRSTGSVITEIPTPRSPSNLARFGSSMVVQGTSLFVGAPEPRSGTLFVGFGYVAQYGVATNALSQIISNPTPGPSPQWFNDEQFGYAMATIGENLIVGDWEDLVSGSRTGGAYLLNGTTGAVLRTFVSPDVASGAADQFGDSVAAFGSKVLIGDNMTDVAGVIQTGAAYLFDANTGQLLQSFYNPHPEILDNFGIEVALFERYAAIGTYDNASTSGAVYIYDVVTGQMVQELHHPGLLEGERFGYSMARLGSNVLAVATISPAEARGRVFIYQLIPEPTTLMMLSVACEFIAIPRMRPRK